MPDARKEPRQTGSLHAFVAVRERAIRTVHDFILKHNLSVREVAAGVGMSEASLRLFLNGGHKVPPHKGTYYPLLELCLDDAARIALLDFIEYRRRVATRAFLRRDHAERARAELRVFSRATDSQV
jgi:hypothetical protein